MSTLPSSPSYSSTLELIQSPHLESSTSLTPIPSLLPEESTENQQKESSLDGLSLPTPALPLEKENSSSHSAEPELLEPVALSATESSAPSLSSDPDLDPNLPALGNLSFEPSSPFSSPLDSEGNFLPEWWAHYPSLQELGKTLQKFKSPQSLAKSYAQLEKMRAYPSSEDPQKWETYRRFMGIAQKPEDYPFEEPKDENGCPLCPWDVDMADCLKAKAHEWAIPPQAFQALAHEFGLQERERYSRLQRDEQKAWQEHQQKSLSTLEKEWGTLCEHKIDQARHTLSHLCLQLGEDPKTLAQDPHIGSHPLFIRLLEYVGRSLSDTPFKGQSHHMSISTAKAEAHRMESDPSHPLYEAYIDYKHPNHKYANSLYDKLITQDA